MQLTEPGSFADKQGVDAYYFGEPAQIKYDKTMTATNNIYHEIYEKTLGKPDQAWRASPHAAKWYFFVCELFGIRIAIETLAIREVDRKLRNINGTSIGFLIPISEMGKDAETVQFQLPKGHDMNTEGVWH